MKVAAFSEMSSDFSESFERFLAHPRGGPGADLRERVGDILADVEARGGTAVAELTARFDDLKIDVETLNTSLIDLDALAAQTPSDVRDAIDFASDRIAAYHTAQQPTDHIYTDALGNDLGWRWTPLDSVGVYVPGGRASYPSSVLMNVIPAKIAGVSRIVMVAPAPGGVLSPAVAYAAKRSGVDAYYPVGGAQAVGALAFGAGQLAAVDKIVGPGNAYVAEAKRQVFGRVGIDTIAGPSEILVIADETANADWVAADLLSQCEHDPASQAILMTPNPGLARRVERAVIDQLQALKTKTTATSAWFENSAIIVTQSLESAVSLSNRVAPEHLELAVGDPDALLDNVRHAGAVFLGHHAPEALGDYVTGSNHVLPTSRAARYASGLGVYDFVKRMSVQRISPDGFAALSPAATALAAAEGLPAHKRSITIRGNQVGHHGQ